MRRTSPMAAVAPIFAMIALTTPTTAGTVLIFAESGPNAPADVKLTDNGNGTTSLSTDIGVTISAIAGPLAPTVPITDATFMLTGISTDFASTAIISGVEYYFQTFSGSYEITAPECGTVCLAGDWVDLQTGPVNGFALAMTASATDVTPNDLTMTSDTIPADLLGFPRGMALAKTALTNAVALDCTAIQGCTLASTSANISGTFSANGAIPEPSTWAMLLLGFAGLGYAGFRRSSKALARLV